MKVFLADSSLFGQGQLLNLLTENKEIEFVGYATEGDFALELIRSMKPDVVILDIKMDGRSGIEVLGIIKREHPQTVVIVLTNSSDLQYRKRCANSGADYFFDKSTEFQRVPLVLDELIQNRKLKRSAISSL